MSREIRSEKPSRRSFLKGAAVAGGAATVAALGPRAQASIQRQPAGNVEQVPEPKGYRETPHVLQYYEKARL